MLVHKGCDGGRVSCVCVNTRERASFAAASTRRVGDQILKLLLLTIGSNYASAGTEQKVAELVRFVREAGRIPVQRDSLYNEIRRWDVRAA